MLAAVAADVRTIVTAEVNRPGQTPILARFGAAQLSASSEWARFHVLPSAAPTRLDDDDDDEAPCEAWPPAPSAFDTEVGIIGRALRSASALAAARPSLQLLGARAADAPLLARLGTSAAELEQQEAVSAELAAGMTDTVLAPVQPPMALRWGVVRDELAPGGLSLVVQLQFTGDRKSVV